MCSTVKKSLISLFQFHLDLLTILRFANHQLLHLFSSSRKILDLGVHTLTGTLSLGFKSVAKENSETVAETIKETLKEFAKLEQIPINIY
jgi:hypothetical protein